MNRRRRTQGFTLIELLLVVVIIGILAAIVVPKLAGRTEDAKIAKAKGDLATLRGSLARYEVDNGKFPSSEQGLAALLVKPVTAPEPKNWKGPYIEPEMDAQGIRLPRDPWGHEYLYVHPGQRNTSGFDLFSGGPDGAPGSDDDIFP